MSSTFEFPYTSDPAFFIGLVSSPLHTLCNETFAFDELPSNTPQLWFNASRPISPSPLQEDLEHHHHHHQQQPQLLLQHHHHQQQQHHHHHLSERHSFPSKATIDTKCLSGSGSGSSLSTSLSSSSLASTGSSSFTTGAAPVAASSCEDDIIYCKEDSPGSESGRSSSFDDRLDEFEREYSQLMQMMESEADDGDYETLPPAPSTQVIDNKPRRGGRQKKDGKLKDELLPPPSSEVLNDPDLLQEYRQERNRLAAKRSRERKKDYIGKLEATCKALKAHGDSLTRELLKLRREVQELKSKGRRKSVQE